jgi:hypothetical protein
MPASVQRCGRRIATDDVEITEPIDRVTTPVE